VLLLLLIFAYGNRRHHSLSVKVFDLLLRPVHKVNEIVRIIIIIIMLNSKRTICKITIIKTVIMLTKK